MIATQKQTPLSGTRPEGTRDEREAAARVRDMFTRIAPRYDFLNHLLSFSLDKVWRRRTAKRFASDFATARCARSRRLLRYWRSGVRARPRTIASARNGAGRADRGQRFRGSDACARAAKRRGRRRSSAVFAAADALRLPFADASFDLVTTAFGFRNLANYEDGLREFARVLKPGGELGILEFTEPGTGPLAGIFRFYFQICFAANRRGDFWQQRSLCVPAQLRQKVSVAEGTCVADGEVRFQRYPHRLVEFRQRNTPLRTSFLIRASDSRFSFGLSTPKCPRVSWLRYVHCGSSADRSSERYRDAPHSRDAAGYGRGGSWRRRLCRRSHG